MIDLLYLTHNRLEFTKASLAALIANTNWSLVDRFLIYDDNSTDGTREYLATVVYPKAPEFQFGACGSPVAVMNHYLSAQSPHSDKIFGKIDSDTMVPAGWLGECLDVMERNRKTLDLLGIEAFNEVIPEPAPRSFTDARYIGGIGLMRIGAFVTLPRPSGRFGFTAWQTESAKVCKGWLNPSLPVFLLDRLPREPWSTLSKEYVEKGWQRYWTPYDETYKPLWSWWCQ